jgi:hypothetical protein
MPTDTIRRPATPAIDTTLIAAHRAFARLSITMEAERGSNAEQLQDSRFRLKQYRDHLFAIAELLERSPELLAEHLVQVTELLGQRMVHVDRRLNRLNAAQVEFQPIDIVQAEFVAQGGVDRESEGARS